ncbi:MAG: ATP-dependent Clp protease, protease subunit [Parcubacteria group bacterium Gr01-1014_13]|nr:MAG: ATP-dependent Clp protease, protease subunit [Parcubacteria group bacterium Gr01-1014_13]
MADLTDMQIAFLEKGIIYLEGEIEEKTFLYVYRCLELLSLKENPPIQINITSPGGDVDCGLLIYDLIRLYSGKTTGRIVGFARSIAMIILQACDKRESTEHSYSLLHYVSERVSLDKIRNDEKLKKFVDQLDKEQKKIYRILKKRTKRPLKSIISLCDKAKDITAQEALDFGLIDKII